MNYAFVSMLIPHGMESELYNISEKNMQDAANALQWHLYNGLCQNLNTNILLINTLPVGSFPQYCKKAAVRRSAFKTKYGEGHVNIGFCNIKLFRRFSQSEKIYRELLKWATATEGDKTVFVYTASGIFLNAVHKLKKRFPDIIICDIIADLPGMTSLSSKKSRLQILAEKKMEKNSYLFLDCVDYFSLLTEQMAEYLQIKKPFCVVEGIATRSVVSEEADTVNDVHGRKIIFYSGTLHKKFGVLTLLEAFDKITDSNYRLQICGVGDSEEEIKKAVSRDSRIEFLGRLSREEVLRLQKNATVLVNPRQNNEEFTKYSFPSKNLEYLSSGIPMIAYKLDGIPNDYDRYICYVEDNSVEALSKKIIDVCELTQAQRHLYGYEARKYVMEHKNEIVQTKKIIQMLSE